MHLRIRQRLWLVKLWLSDSVFFDSTANVLLVVTLTSAAVEIND